MSIKMFPDGVNYRLFTKENIGKFCYPESLKDKGDLLYFLKHYKDQAIISGIKLTDPVTGEVFSNGTEYYQIQGLEWSNATTYFFEKYDIRLNEEFLDKTRAILKKDILKRR